MNNAVSGCYVNREGEKFTGCISPLALADLIPGGTCVFVFVFCVKAADVSTNSFPFPTLAALIPRTMYRFQENVLQQEAEGLVSGKSREKFIKQLYLPPVPRLNHQTGLARNRLLPLLDLHVCI